MNKKKFCKIFFPILGVAVLLTGVYWSIIEFVLKDYKDIGVIQFRYIRDENNENSPAYITGIKTSAKHDYPEVFEVPSKLLGHPVVGIDAKAFTNLDHLKKVILPKTVEEIGDEAFSECPLLTEVVVQGDLKTVGNDIFKNSGWLDAHDDEEFIRFEKFLYKYNGNRTSDFTLKSEKEKLPGENPNDYVYIPSDIKKLCGGSFIGVDHLKVVDMPSEYNVIERNLFKDCKDLQQVNIKNINVIESYAFSGCENLENIDLSRIENIGVGAFENTALEEVTLSSALTTINQSTFEGCDELVNITIPNSVSSIGNRAFLGASSLTSIDVPESVKTIGAGAFKETGLTSFDFPSDVDTISDELFADCINLTSVNLPDVTKVDEGKYTGIVSVGAKAFYNTTSLSAVDFPTLIDGETVVDPVKTIGASAFENSSITSVRIPKDVTILYDATFKNCQQLTTVEFAKDGALKTINAECFMNTTSLSEIEFPNSVYEFFNAVLMNSAVTKVTLPNNTMFQTITRSFFENCTELVDVTIPESVNTLFQDAFKNCSSLTSLTLSSNIWTVSSDVFLGTSDSFTLVIIGDESVTSYWDVNWSNGLSESQIIYQEQ